ncbi:MAG: TIGR02996 domain-containing protein [Myxococcales bacterium]|nr:TIGR02996 domain-containing protein [Myxococcales bacterium]
MTEEELLRQIAVRPFELEPRLVYADYLAEQGDPRAEVISLGARGDLTLAERRRVKGIIKDHGRRWLGPLKLIADSSESQYRAGFLDSLKLAFSARPADLLSMSDEPRLATVRSLDASALRTPQPLGQFLRQPAFSSLTRLVVSPEAVSALAGAPVPFSLEALGLCDNSSLEDGFGAFAGLPLAHSAPRWELVSPLLFASLMAFALWEALLRDPLTPFRNVPELRLVVPYGVFEGVATWLTLPFEHRQELKERWPGGVRFSIEAPGLRLTLLRGVGGGWPDLEIVVAGEGMRDVDDYVSRLASVLVLLGPAELESVTIEIPRHLTPTRAHRYAIKSAARRLRGAAVTMGGEALVP